MSGRANLRTGNPSRRSRLCQPILSDPGRSEQFSEVGYSLTVAISWQLSSEKTVLWPENPEWAFLGRLVVRRSVELCCLPPIPFKN